MEIRYNPWPGLASYEDPQSSKNPLLFSGRGHDSYDMARLVDENLFVTIYGRSGIGKTSLMKAGVFPIIRKDNYFPLVMRLGTLKGQKGQGMLQQAIIDTVEKAITDAGGEIKETKVVQPSTNTGATDYLWNYFARKIFYNKDGEVVFPVFVLDQFEEVFRDETLREASIHLLSQINYMIDETHAIEDVVVDGEPYSYDFNFRFIVSIREDDLFRLEEEIDNAYLPELKKCRYRLNSLTKNAAREVVLNPCPGLFADAEAAADKIINVATEKGKADISSPILSLICNRLYQKYGTEGETISSEQIDEYLSDDPFEKFYREITADLTDKERAFVEDNFVDSDGRRGSIAIANFRRDVPNGMDLLKEGPNRIFQRFSVSSNSERDRVELIHDSFCDPLIRMRTARHAQEAAEEKRKKNRMRNRRQMNLVLGAAFVGAMVLVGIIAQKNRASLKAESDALGAVGRLWAQDGNDYAAIRMAIYAIDSLIPGELAYNTLRSSSARGFAVLHGHKYSVNTMAFDPKGRWLATGSWDSSIYFWDPLTGKKVSEVKMPSSDSDVLSISTNQDGTLLASGSRDSLRIWKVETQLNQKGQRDTCKVDSLAFFPVDENYVYNRVLFSPDGKYLVAGCLCSDENLGSIKIYHKNGERLEKYHSHKVSGIRSLVFIENNLFVAGQNNGKIDVWDVTNGKPQGTIKPSGSPVYSLAYHPGTNSLAAGYEDGTIEFFEFDKTKNVWEKVKSCKAHISIVHGLCFDDEGKRLFSCSADKSVIIWDVESNPMKELMMWEDHSKSVFEVHLSPAIFLIDSTQNDTTQIRLLASCSDDASVRLRNIQDYLFGHANIVRPVVVYRDPVHGDRIYSGDQDGQLLEWDYKHSRYPKKMAAAESSIWSMCLSPSQNYLAYGCGYRPENDRVDVNRETEDLKAFLYILQRKGDEWGDTTKIAYKKTVMSIAMSEARGNIRIATGEDNGNVVIWNRQGEEWVCSDTLLRPGDNHGINKPIAYSLAFSPDGRLLAAGFSEKTFIVWDLDNRDTSIIVKPPKQNKKDKQDTQKKQNRKKNQKKQDELSSYAHEWDVNEVAFSPDGHFLATGSDDQRVVFWEIKRDKEGSLIGLQYFAGIPKENTLHHSIYSMQFLPNQPNDNELEMVITQWRGACILRLNTKTKTIEKEFYQMIHDGYTVRVVYLDEAGTGIVSTSLDNTLHITPLYRNKLLDNNRERFKTHPMTKEEKEKVLID